MHNGPPTNGAYSVDLGASTASSTASKSSTRCVSEGASATGSDKPMPRPSNTTNAFRVAAHGPLLPTDARDRRSSRFCSRRSGPTPTSHRRRHTPDTRVGYLRFARSEHAHQSRQHCLLLVEQNVGRRVTHQLQFRPSAGLGLLTNSRWVPEPAESFVDLFQCLDLAL